MTWVGFVRGVPLLIWGWTIGKRRCPWTSTSGEVIEAGRYKGFRWTDGENAPRQVLLRPEDAQELATGSVSCSITMSVTRPGGA